MASFEIQIIPPIPAAIEIHSEFYDLNPRWQEINAIITQQYHTIYHVNEEKFAYYPTDVITTFNDLKEELIQFKASNSHYVNIAGYNVAYARCLKGAVWFYDPPRILGTEDQVELKGEGVPLALVVKSLEQSTSAVWEQIARSVKM